MVLASDSGAFVNQVDVVGEERVAGVLRDDTEGDKNRQPPPVTLCLDKVYVARILVRIGFQTDDLSHFNVFELNGCIVLVATGMVVREGVQSLLVAFLGDQPTRTWRVTSA